MRKLKTRHTVLSVLLLTWVVSQIDRTAMSVALPYISADYHLSAFEGGLLMSAFFAGYAISHIPGGVLADLFGVRKVATAAMLWWSIFTAASGAMATFTQLVVVRFVFGLGEGVFPACAFKAIAIWFPKRERATASAIMIASNPLGMALGPLAVVSLMSIGGWRTAFLSLFLLGLIAATLFWLLVPDASPGPDRHPDDLGDSSSLQHTETLKKPSGIAVFREAIGQPNIVRLSLAYFAFCIGAWGFISWLPTYLVRARGLSMAQMGVLAALPFFAGTIGDVLGGWVSDRFFRHDRRLPVLFVQVAASIFLYLTLRSQSTVVLIISQTLAGFFLMSISPCFWALPMNTVPVKVMGSASGVINMAGQVAGIISPLILGSLLSGSGNRYDLAFYLIIASLVASAAVVVTIPRPSSNVERDGAAASGSMEHHTELIDVDDRS